MKHFFGRNAFQISYYSNGVFSAIELPYGNGRFVMILALPGEDKTVSDVIAWLSGDQQNEWFGEFREVPALVVRIPKFRFDYHTLLNQALSDMGLRVAFTEFADFRGMLEENVDLGISRAIHKSYIDVNEEGTEAAAVTAAELSFTSVQEPTSFVADRPFLFIIREKETGIILFTGKVSRPEYE